MFNFGWGILFVVVNFALMALCYRLYGKSGLFAWVGMATVVANVQVIKTIEMLGIVMTLGNTMFATINLTIDLLNEKYGQKEAKRAVWMGFFSLIATTIIMQMVLVFTPQPNDLAHDALSTVFYLMPRIAAASLCAYLVGQFLDVRIFSWLRKHFGKDKQLWIRATGSTAISQIADSLVFCSIAFINEFPLKDWLQIVLSTYILKLVISVIATPVLYWIRNFHPQEGEDKKTAEA